MYLLLFQMLNNDNIPVDRTWIYLNFNFLFFTPWIFFFSLFFLVGVFDFFKGKGLSVWRGTFGWFLSDNEGIFIEFTAITGIYLLSLFYKFHESLMNFCISPWHKTLVMHSKASTTKMAKKIVFKSIFRAFQRHIRKRNSYENTYRRTRGDPCCKNSHFTNFRLRHQATPLKNLFRNSIFSHPTILSTEIRVMIIVWKIYLLRFNDLF